MTSLRYIKVEISNGTTAVIAVDDIRMVSEDISGVKIHFKGLNSNGESFCVNHSQNELLAAMESSGSMSGINPDRMRVINV